MSELLEQVLDAHGGVEQWQSVQTIVARGRLGGLPPKRFAGNKLASFAFEVQVAAQHAVLHDFPRAGTRAVSDRGSVRLEGP